jgi:hypothetical protein
MRFEDYSTEQNSLAAFDEAMRLLYQMHPDHLELLRDFIVKKIKEWEQELAVD